MFLVRPEFALKENYKTLFFTKLVPYDNWFREQQRIMKMGGKIIKVELATGKQGMNTGLS